LSGYRFCRTDDMPLLVEAYSRAYAPHFPDLPPLDVAGLKRWIRERDLWSSSCMVAVDGEQPIGVLLGCKRPTETLVLAIGIAPDHLRRGHGRHLLTSLSSKLAILGPPRLLAEVPEDDARAVGFFRACGWTDQEQLRDFALSGGGAPTPPGPIVPVTVDELLASDALDPAAPRSWARAHEILLRRRDELRGLAVASPDRLEAWLLWREDAAEREIMALGRAPDDAGTTLLGVLVRHLAGLAATPLAFRKVGEQEMPWSCLEGWGFQARRSHRRFTATARPA
jgi:ribosomal protein S18 acetylase RimI-like enzyme